MKKTFAKKMTLITATVGVSALPVVAVVSCSSKASKASNLLQKLDYDFGVAVEPMSNLNYLKNSIGKIQPTLITPLIQSGPKGTLQNILKLPSFKAQMLKWPDSGAHSNMEVAGSAEMTKYGEFAGGIAQETGSYAFYGDNFGGKLHSVFLNLNRKNTWKGAADQKFNRPIVAQDYIDGIKYILDINNSSSLVEKIKNIGIIGVAEMYQAQMNYAANMGGKIYSDPWGFNQEAAGLDFTNDSVHLPSENDGDDVYVAQIENAARKMLKEGIKLNDIDVAAPSRDEFSLRINFDESSDETFSLFDSYYIKDLLPANREFIESVGGFYNFGSSLDTFIYCSPFNISSARLGQGGYINLEKDTGYFGARYTLANKIKVYFQDDPNVLSSMFEDGYISATPVSGTYLKRFWADPNLRQYLTKTNGFGTVALRFNVKQDENYILNDPDLRLAIAYAINRPDYIKLAGWDSTVTTSMWPAKGSSSTADGRPTDVFYEGETYSDSIAQITQSHPDENKDGKPDEIKLVSTNFYQRASILYKFEHAERKDERFDAELANAHLKAFLDKHKMTSVSLTYLGTGEMATKQALGLKSQFNDVFGGKLDLNIKMVPQSTYTNMIMHGDFDISVDNFDKFGLSRSAYYNALTWEDGVGGDIHKSSGYLANPTGSWTFSKFYDRIVKETKEQVVKQNLGASDELWDYFKKFAENSSVQTTQNKQLIDRMFNNLPIGNEPAKSVEFMSKFYILLEKIVAYDAPVVPLYEVDTNWSINRLVGVNNIYTYDLQYGYDELKPPRPNLPMRDK